MRQALVVSALALAVAAHDGPHDYSSAIAYKPSTVSVLVPSPVLSSKVSVAIAASPSSSTKSHAPECDEEPPQPAYACITQPEVDSKVPSCAKQCTKSAFEADGCGYGDVGCHCSKTAVVGSVLIPCLLNSTCVQADFDVLEKVLNPVCAYFNATRAGHLSAPSCGVKTVTQSTTSTSAAVAATATPYQAAQFQGQAAAGLRSLSWGAIMLVAVAATFLT